MPIEVIEMNNYLLFLRNYLWIFYLGVSTALIIDKGILNWRWWAIGIPINILFCLRK
jgi:hypothetical protein